MSRPTLMQAHRTQGLRSPQAKTHLDTVCLGSQTSVNPVRVNITIVGVTPPILMATPFRAPVTARKEAIIIDTNCQQVRYRPLLQPVSEITASPLQHHLRFSTLVLCLVSSLLSIILAVMILLRTDSYLSGSSPTCVLSLLVILKLFRLLRVERAHIHVCRPTPPCTLFLPSWCFCSTAQI
ncbi:hypothetical protein PILCRDRAFT_755129 [Piloderma croceum F 1598]|uniref:Uncharacterized protein n=1 Tax=Piloderma croceum (strain F 1598) TaxID=765440 RepID=A0A0C3EFD8_PILCF|nr:hypothetical protein PILCRDRAFT_755129 [Piloderma croceum F 1598]